MDRLPAEAEQLCAASPYGNQRPGDAGTRFDLANAEHRA